MPRTPEFSIHQDDEYVYVVIKVPYIRVKDTEILTDGVDFTFFCKPYLLKLSFPYELEDSDDERCRAVYDPNTENGIITAHLVKKEKGLYFPDLDLTTRLLAIRSSNDKKLYSKDSDLLPSIEVMSSSFCDNDDDDDDDENLNGDASSSSSSSSKNVLNTDGTFSTDYHSGDHTDIVKRELRLSNLPKYGFNLQYSGVLGKQKVESEESNNIIYL